MNIGTTKFPEHIRYLKENTDWDELVIAYEKRLNKSCIAVIIVACLYFSPVVIKVFLK